MLALQLHDAAIQLRDAAIHLHVHLHLLHHLKGATIDYVGLALAACVSWIAGIGPGEPILVAAGVFAAKHKLDISPVVFWAWIGAATGGVIGWLIGMKAGRAVLIAPGPLRKLRLNSVRHGEALFKRREAMAIVLTPPWVAGINRSHARLYLPINAVTSLLLWAIPLGLGAYYAGPPILDLAGDAGLILTSIVVVAAVAVVTVEVRRRRRRRRTAARGARAPEGSATD
jgi:membrane protein DedA with SNARE-associated domain